MLALDQDNQSSSDEKSVVSVQGRQGNVTFRPYRDIKTRHIGADHDDGDDDHEVVSINQLYPELLCHIFSYLDTGSKGSAAQASRQWRNIFNTKEIWRGCTARLNMTKLSTSCVLRSLKVRGIKKIQILAVKKSINELISNLPALSSLDMSGCAGINDTILARALLKDDVSLTVDSLVELNLSLCKGLTDASSRVIVMKCPNLEVLDLGGCTGITNTSLSVLASLKKLRSLNLRSCWQVSDSGVMHLSSSAESLQQLNLQDCQKVSDTALRHLSHSLISKPGLSQLNLSFCANVSDSGMKSLSKISSLRSLNLRSCDNITDIGVGYLAEASVGLTTLDLSFCDKVSDRALDHIASGLFNLTHLSLISCRITDEGLGKICKTLADLHVLNIGQCSALTDSALEHIGLRLKRMEFLDLYGCNRISSEGLATLESRCPNLKKINLNLWHSQ